MTPDRAAGTATTRIDFYHASCDGVVVRSAFRMCPARRQFASDTPHAVRGGEEEALRRAVEHKAVRRVKAQCVRQLLDHWVAIEIHAAERHCCTGAQEAARTTLTDRRTTWLP